MPEVGRREIAERVEVRALSLAATAAGKLSRLLVCEPYGLTPRVQ